MVIARLLGEMVANAGVMLCLMMLVIPMQYFISRTDYLRSSVLNHAGLALRKECMIQNICITRRAA